MHQLAEMGAVKFGCYLRANAKVHISTYSSGTLPQDWSTAVPRKQGNGVEIGITRVSRGTNCFVQWEVAFAVVGRAINVRVKISHLERESRTGIIRLDPNQQSFAYSSVS